jgi:hypothetical protein
MSHRISLRRLQPHYAGAEPEQFTGRKGAWEIPGQVDHEVTGEWLHRRGTYYSALR